MLVFASTVGCQPELWLVQKHVAVKHSALLCTDGNNMCSSMRPKSSGARASLTSMFESKSSTVEQK